MAILIPRNYCIPRPGGIDKAKSSRPPCQKDGSDFVQAASGADHVRGL